MVFLAARKGLEWIAEDIIGGLWEYLKGASDSHAFIYLAIYSCQCWVPLTQVRKTKRDG